MIYVVLNSLILVFLRFYYNSVNVNELYFFNFWYWWNVLCLYIYVYFVEVINYIVVDFNLDDIFVLIIFIECVYVLVMIFEYLNYFIFWVKWVFLVMLVIRFWNWNWDSINREIENIYVGVVYGWIFYYR